MAEGFGLPASQLDELAAAWRERLKADEYRRQRLAQRARADAEAIAELLVDRFGATRVYLFGSLTVPGGFRESSDIDLAVEGMRAEQFIRASAEAARTTSFSLDLVPLEDAHPELRRIVLSEGVLLAQGSEAANGKDGPQP